MSRPNEYNASIADAICDLVANGSNLNRIGQMEDYPSRSTIYKWFKEQPEFSDNYARARQDRADWRADKIDDVCEKVINGELKPDAARVIIDAHKWQAGKENGSRYGDKTQIDLAGVPGKPVETVTRIELVAPTIDDNQTS